MAVLTYSQPGCDRVFSGRIQGKSGDPIVGAAVILFPSQQGQTTGVTGDFRFEGLCAGKYQVKVQFIGYRDVAFEVVIDRDIDRTITLEEVALELQEVVVHHHDDMHTEHAVNYDLLGERQLAELAGKSLGESLRKLPGVNTIQTGPGIFKPVIHGVHSQRVLILNHGIRHEGQQWGAEHAPEIDPFIASSIVVIKDASAIKYGTDALGGVIVVNPPALPERADVGGTLHSVVQSNGRSAALSGMLEGGIKGYEGWGWRAQGTVKRSGDFSTPRYVLTNTGIKEYNFSLSAGYHREKVGFDAFFSRFQTEIGILKGTAISNLDDLIAAMERDVPQYTRNFSYKIEEPRQEVSHSLLKLNGHVLTEHGEWRWQYGFQQNKRREFDIRRGGLSDIPAIDLELSTHALQTEWETVHTDRRTFSIGADALYQSNRNIPGTQRIPFIPNFNNVSAGVFGLSKFFLNQWTFDLGARYDYRHYSVKGYDFKNSLYSASLRFGNLSATAGATWQPDPDQALSLSVSTAWRPPHVAELYSLGTHQSAAAIEYGLLLNENTNEVMDMEEANFKTEQAMKVVTTYRRSWQRITFSVSPYVNSIFNYIYLIPRGITKNVRGVYPYYRYTQTDALFTGADVSGVWQVGKHLQITSQATWLYARDVRHHDRLSFVPSNRYEASVRYEIPGVIPSGNIYFESGVVFVSKQKHAPRVITVREIQEANEQNFDLFRDDNSNFDFMPAPDGYWLWKASAGVSVKSKSTRIDFRIASENILNEQYREYTNRLRYYADESGRNIILAIRCIF